MGRGSAWAFGFAIGGSLLEMTTGTRDPRFATGELVKLTAAVAGISRVGWTAIQASDATEQNARATMARERFDVLPVENSGNVEGYFHTMEWNDYSRITRGHISDEDVVLYDSDIRDVISLLSKRSRPFVFLRDDHDVVGLFSVVNLNRRPVKVWLFNLLSEIEVRLGEFVSRHVNDQELYSLTLGATTDPKHEAVKRHYKTDQKNGLELPVAEYLYFKDLIKVAVSNSLHRKLDSSRTHFERSLGSLAALRDEVAHPARSLVREAKGVMSLQRRVERIDDTLKRLRRSLTSG